MTLSTLVRFTEPIDPRLAWKVAVTLIDSPKNYEYYTRKRHSEDFGGSWPDNDEWQGTPGQGARALLSMAFGHEGATLADDAYDHYDSPRPPTGYVELDFDTTYGYQDELGGCERLHARIIRQIDAWSPVPIAWCNEFTGEWFTGTDGLESFG